MLLIPFVSFSQSNDGIDICLALQSNNFTTNAEADKALTRIINASGLAKNFALISCDNINNALAVSYKGERFIIYDKKFMSLISSKTNDWSNLTILAHEVGHHLNGHSIDLSMAKIVEPKSLAEKRRQELEADEFAGFVMAKLGAPLNSVISSISLITTDEDDTYSTHPKRSKRLASLKSGYYKGSRQYKLTENEKKDEKKADEIVNFDVPPIFPGCEMYTNKDLLIDCFNNKLKKHIAENFNYPEAALKMGIQGVVKTMFIIGNDGLIGDIKYRGPNTLLEEEALRILKLIPRLTPAKHNGKSIKIPYSIPITFKLK